MSRPVHHLIIGLTIVFACTASLATRADAQPDNDDSAAAQLQSLGQVLLKYVKEHSGEFPDHLADLLIIQDPMAPEVLVEPATPIPADFSKRSRGEQRQWVDQNSRFTYVENWKRRGGLKGVAPRPDDILAYQTQPDAAGHAMVLFGDGRVEHLGVDDAIKKIAGEPPAPASLQLINNLRLLGEAMYMYTQDNRGRFPDHLDQLLSYHSPGIEIIVRPDTEVPAGYREWPADRLREWIDQHGAYTYVAKGKKITDRWGQVERFDNPVVAYQTKPDLNNRGMSAALFKDGHVEILPMEEIKKYLP